MRSLLSPRRETFYRLVREAYKENSSNLHTIVIDKKRSILVRLACLRILTSRDYGLDGLSGLPYPQRKKAVRQSIGI